MSAKGAAYRPTLDATILAAKLGGFLPGPVPLAKGVAGMPGLANAGFFGPDNNVVFPHTGGSAALFAYEDNLSEAMGHGSGHLAAAAS